MPDLRLTVLGASPAWANPGGACSGYLVTSGRENVLLECGFGVLSRLRDRLPLDELSAIVISHLHADHFMDLVPLRYGLKYGRLRTDYALPLYAPPGSTEFFARLGSALDGDLNFFDHTYRLTEYRPGIPLRIGALSIEFRAVKHYIQAFGMAITAHHKLAFSGDAAPCKGLIELARNADLFLCEAAINGLDEDDPNPDRRGHMTASEAGVLAREANVGRLLLTHFRSKGLHDGELVSRASAAFKGPVELAREGMEYEI